MQTEAGDTQAGDGNDPKVVRRWVASPIGFTVEMEIDSAGVLSALGVSYGEDLPWSMAWAVQRALAWALDRLDRAAAGGQLAADILEELPLGPVADIERALMAEVAAVQALRLPGVLGGAL